MFARRLSSARIGSEPEHVEDREQAQGAARVKQVGDVVDEVAENLAVTGLRNGFAWTSLVVTTRPSRFTLTGGLFGTVEAMVRSSTGAVAGVEVVFTRLGVASCWSV